MWHDCRLFELSEYRVYLLGGANARKEDTHAVYTPAFFKRGRLNMIFRTLKPDTMMNVLLPEGQCYSSQCAIVWCTFTVC